MRSQKNTSGLASLPRRTASNKGRPRLTGFTHVQIRVCGSMASRGPEADLGRPRPREAGGCWVAGQGGMSSRLPICPPLGDHSALDPWLPRPRPPDKDVCPSRGVLAQAGPLAHPRVGLAGPHALQEAVRKPSPSQEVTRGPG